MTILQRIYEHGIQFPSKTAVYEGENVVSYSQLWDAIERAAAYFRTVGQHGDRIVLSASKSVGFVYSYFGVHLAGMIAITVDPEISEIRMQRIFEAVTPVGVYGTLALEGYGVLPFPDYRQLETVVDISFPELDDIADILFTTGTTGMPKGVVLTHRNEWAAATNINTFIGQSADSVELLALPISHSFGLGRLRCIMQIGATIDILGSFASMKKFFREIEHRSVTGFGMVPASWNYMMKMSGEKIADYAHQLKYIEIGSAFMPVEEKERLINLLPNTRICMHYGLTEASRSAFMCLGDECRHLASIGYPSPNCDIKIFSDDATECKPEVEGEVCVKGEHVCANYWGDSAPEYTSAFYERYFRTGDWGYKDAEGRIHLVSRKKELINVGGKKVSPIEVEEVIDTLEGVKESACIGVFDPVLGEVVKAFVVLKSCADVTLEDIQKLAQRKLENYKVPACMEIIDTLPRTSSGKLQRLLLKK